MKSFLTWLSENHAMGGRSCRDVASRLKRASKFIDIDSDLPDDELLFRLGTVTEFKKTNHTCQVATKTGCYAI